MAYHQCEKCQYRGKPSNRCGSGYNLAPFFGSTIDFTAKSELCKARREIIETNAAYELVQIQGKLGPEIRIRLKVGELTPHGATHLGRHLILWAMTQDPEIETLYTGILVGETI